MLEQSDPELAGRGQLALRRSGDHFFEVPQGAITAFVEPQQGAHKVVIIAGVLRGTFQGVRLLHFRQRMERLCLTRFYPEIGLRKLRGRRPCGAPCEEQ